MRFIELENSTKGAIIINVETILTVQEAQIHLGNDDTMMGSQIKLIDGSHLFVIAAPHDVIMKIRG